MISVSTKLSAPSIWQQVERNNVSITKRNGGGGGFTAEASQICGIALNAEKKSLITQRKEHTTSKNAPFMKCISIVGLVE